MAAPWATELHKRGETFLVHCKHWRPCKCKAPQQMRRYLVRPERVFDVDRRIALALRAFTTVSRAPIVVLYDQNPDYVGVESVDRGVRKDLHRKAATPAAAASADPGLLDRQGRQALEFGEEPRGQRRRAFALMEGRSIQKVSLGPG